MEQSGTWILGCYQINSKIKAFPKLDNYRKKMTIAANK